MENLHGEKRNRFLLTYILYLQWKYKDPNKKKYAE